MQNEEEKLYSEQQTRCYLEYEKFGKLSLANLEYS